MKFTYKFKKDKLANGLFVSRPRIFVEVQGTKNSVLVPALVDSGCDMTVILESIASQLGISLDGSKDLISAFREKSEVVHSFALIRFVGKYRRETTVVKVPILVVLSRPDFVDEEEIVLGVEGIFDYFEINFKKSKNKIIMKKV